MKRLGLALALWASLSLAAVAQVGGLMFPGPGPGHSSGGGTLTFTPSATTVPWVTGPSPPTNFSADIGTASADRIVVVAIAVDAGTAQVVSGVTINGVTATKDSFFDPPSSLGGGGGGLYIYHALVTSGSGSQTIQLQSAGFPGAWGIAVGMITGSATASFSAGNVKAFTASQFDPQVMTSTTIPANGVGVVCTILDRPGTPSWSGAALAKTTTATLGNQFTLSMASGTNPAPSFTGANGFGVGMAMTTFGP